MKDIAKKTSSLLLSALLAFTAAFAVMPAATVRAEDGTNGGGQAIRRDLLWMLIQAL